MEIMSTDRKNDTYTDKPDSKSAVSSVMKLGLVSAASAIVGGLAAAWWYRKTISKLQNPILSEDQYGTVDRMTGEKTAGSGEEDELPHLVND
jgi:hypothetical protein